MVMNSAFATTIALIVPVIILAVGAEAREFEKQTRGRRGWSIPYLADRFLEIARIIPDDNPSYSEEDRRAVRKLMQLEIAEKISGLDFEKLAKSENPGIEVSFFITDWIKREIISRLCFLFAGIAWSGVFTMLIVAEALSIGWLGQANPGPEPGVAKYSLITIIISMIFVYAAPISRLVGSLPGIDFFTLTSKTLYNVAREYKRLEDNPIWSGSSIEESPTVANERDRPGDEVAGS